MLPLAMARVEMPLCRSRAVRPVPVIPSRMDLGSLLESEGARVGLEVGVQRGYVYDHTCPSSPTVLVALHGAFMSTSVVACRSAFLEALLLSWPSGTNTWRLHA